MRRAHCVTNIGVHMPIFTVHLHVSEDLKCKKVLLQVPSPLFNFWVSVGVFLESVCIFCVYGRFTPWGIVSGLLFVLSTANTFFAIQYTGLAIASATWCGTAVLVSFGFGLACVS